MAGSRLEKIGTIYTRTSALLSRGAMNWEDRPIWYDIYEAFPPKDEPRFDRPAPNLKLKPILYKEDKVRAIFHRNNKHIGAVQLTNNNYKSLTQKFIDTYIKLEEQEGPGDSESLYTQAIEILNKERNTQKSSDEDEVSLSKAFKQAQSIQVKQEEAPKITVKVSDLFKE